MLNPLKSLPFFVKELLKKHMSNHEADNIAAKALFVLKFEFKLISLLSAYGKC